MHRDTTQQPGAPYPADAFESLPPATVAMSVAAVEEIFARPDLIREIEHAVQPFQVRIEAAPDGVWLEGDGPAKLVAARIFEALTAETEAGRPFSPDTHHETISDILDKTLKRDLAFRLEGLAQPLRPMSMMQLSYMNDLLSDSRPLVFGIGPTGTGKTHLAIAAGLSLLSKGKVKHLIISRPHIVFEGKSSNPAIGIEVSREEEFAAIYDTLHSLLTHAEVERLIKQRQLELPSLTLLRGRTFSDAFIVLDEAQFTTVGIMRMAVTRMGRGSRMVITGDLSQPDVRPTERNGLQHLLSLIKGTDIGAVHQFEHTEIIRNSTVARLESLYARNWHKTNGVSSAA